MTRMSLRSRLYLGFALVAAVFVAGAAVNLWLLHGHRDGLEQLARVEFEIQDHAQELRHIVTEMQRLALLAALEADEDQLIAASAQSNRFFDKAEALRGLLRESGSDTAQITAIEDSYRRVMTSVLTLIAEHIEGIAEKGDRLSGVHAAADRFIGELDRFVVETKAHSQGEVARLLDQLDHSIWAHWLAIGFAAFMAFGALVVLDRSLTRPTSAMAESLERIARHPVHSTERLASSHDDEIGRIGTGVNSLLGRLRETAVSRDYFDHVVGSLTNAVLVTTPEGLVETANRASLDMLGYGEAELKGLPIEGVVTAAQAPDWKLDLPTPAPEESRGSIVEQLLEKDRIRNVEMAFLAKGGDRIPVLFSGAVMRGEDGDITGLVCVATDITERVATEETLARKTLELETSNEELRRFAYVASHDLQEPLRIVTTYLQFFEQRFGKGLDGEAREFIDIVVDAAKRMRNLIRDFLVYSRIEGQETVMGATDLGEVVEAALANLEPRIDETGADINISESLPTVTGSPVRLISLFQNLIGNAIKYRDPDRRPDIRIFVEPYGDDWRIGVSDNGIGIEPKYGEKIFVLFQRLHGQGVYDGTGIGLALCKRIVEQHGGRIWMTSAPGEGSTFYFTLPKG